jgi:hypothetical protein
MDYRVRRDRFRQDGIRGESWMMRMRERRRRKKKRGRVMGLVLRRIIPLAHCVGGI